QGLDFLPGEIFSEPTAVRYPIDHLCGVSVSKLRSRGHIGGGGDLVFVRHHQHTVFGRDNVWFYCFCAQVNRESVAGFGVLRPISGSPTVSNDEGGSGFVRHSSLA